MKELSKLQALQSTSRMTLRKVTFNYLKNESEIIAIPNDWDNRNENSRWTYKGVTNVLFLMSVNNPFTTSTNPMLYLGADIKEFRVLQEYLKGIFND